MPLSNRLRSTIIRARSPTPSEPNGRRCRILQLGFARAQVEATSFPRDPHQPQTLLGRNLVSARQSFAAKTVKAPDGGPFSVAAELSAIVRNSASFVGDQTAGERRRSGRGPLPQRADNFCDFLTQETDRDDVRPLGVYKR